MKKVFRFALLALGCVVMVATSPQGSPVYGPPILPVTLEPGVAQTYAFAAGEKSKKEDERGTPLVPRVHMRGENRLGATTPVSRVVGIVSERYPFFSEYSALAAYDTFTVGQEIANLGTVAFVHEVPFTTRSIDGQGKSWVLPKAREYVLTLLVQGGTVDLELSMPAEELMAECGGCEVEYGFALYGSQPYLSNPDGGVGDGGVGDGG